MEVLAAYLACVVLGMFGVRLGVPEAYHTIMDHRHAACLRRTAVLEVALGMRDAPLPETRRPRLSPQSAADRWATGVNGAAQAKATNFTQGIQSRQWLAILSTPRKPASLDASGNEVDPETLPYPYCGPGTS